MVYTRKITKVLLPFLCIVICGTQSGADEDRLYWFGDIPAFLNQQHAYSLAAAEALLDKYPPSLEAPLERRSAFLLLDNVFHDPEAVNYEAVSQFFLRRTQAAAAALQDAPPAQGARIWKLYNHGFIVCSATATVAFDIISGQHFNNEAFRLPEAVVDAFADQCDALFISHWHRDHADFVVAQAFIDRGKPVVLPQGFWNEEPIAAQLTRFERDASTVHALPVREGSVLLDVVVYPGHQGEDTLNNITLVRFPDGFTVAHTGDQSNLRDFKWMDAIKQRHRVDVLLPNCWTPAMPRMIAGFDPEVVILGHENELGHTIDHREPYWLNARRLGEATVRAVAMTWGESYAYTRSRK